MHATLYLALCAIHLAACNHALPEPACAALAALVYAALAGEAGK